MVAQALACVGFDFSRVGRVAKEVIGCTAIRACVGTKQQAFFHSCRRLQFVRWVRLAAADANVGTGLNVDWIFDVSKIECPSIYAGARPEPAIEYPGTSDSHCQERFRQATKSHLLAIHSASRVLAIQET